ncbi:agmatinase [Thermus scotoductus]|uniref:Agmatinase n=3 Tax=Thermus TaxID=270 RepID=A0A430RQK0_THESC|nr:agmatinase [Thermus scotoductus]ADW21598.1 agmatinase [Thermus scotoductus SA-01]RTH21425.1 agmatinase [Thermus scotoductus]RTH96288.1 agmatinase [Thermus scotoductus]RTI16891.1 agmatinase [Thermus scotoductus]
MRLVFGERDTPYEEARVVVLPVPYDLSLSFLPGARRGPEAILLASRELEPFLLELGVTPEEVGIHAAEPVPWVAGSAEESHALIREAALGHLRAGKFVVSLGGDHSITHPLVQAHREVLGEFSLLQMDAHADLYPVWQGSIYSHASPFYRLVEEGFSLVQVGIRAIDQDSLAWARGKGVALFPAHRLHREGLPIREILEALGERVYISLDFDALDPSVMPSVGTPLPGGLSYRQVVDLLSAVFQEKEVVGMDFVELSPTGQFHAEMTAAQLVYHAIGLKGLQAGWLEAHG